ncbi:hypothetical protein CI102_670 [Trichoderma harzianum]|nr:hypothetical protein CI102_670 [Trichoderma harzianum]
MRPFTLLLLVTSTNRLGAIAKGGTSVTSSELGSSCCNELHKELPCLVHYPSSSEYESRNAGYYSKQQQELHPECVLRPKVTDDVSRILQIANSLQFPFAVASGGICAGRDHQTLMEAFLLT